MLICFGFMGLHRPKLARTIFKDLKPEDRGDLGPYNDYVHILLDIVIYIYVGIKVMIKGDSDYWLSSPALQTQSPQPRTKCDTRIGD